MVNSKTVRPRKWPHIKRISRNLFSQEN